MKIRIGVTMNYRVNEKRTSEEALLDNRYLDYLVMGGAAPVPIMPTDDREVVDALLDSVRGVLFTGGLDLDPRLWSAERHAKTTSLHPRRQESELMLYEMTHQRRLPIMGICLGIQLINVAHGGTLHQHVPDIERDVVHQQENGIAQHELTLAPNSQLHEWLRTDTIMVNSFHHQAISRLGRGLKAAAHASNGLVEAVEEPGYPFLLGVQWHPERDMAGPVNKIILERFVEAARATPAA